MSLLYIFLGQKTKSPPPFPLKSDDLPVKKVAVGDVSCAVQQLSMLTVHAVREEDV